MQMISRYRRFESMLIDHVIMCILLAAAIFIVHVTGRAAGDHFFTIKWHVRILMAIYFLKDSIHGRSPDKRHTDTQVVDNTSGLPATPLQCFVRNMTIIIWPVEVLVTWFNPAKRAGDRLARTRVAVYDPERPAPPVSILQVALAALPAAGYSLLTYALL